MSSIDFRRVLTRAIPGLPVTSAKLFFDCTCDPYSLDEQNLFSLVQQGERVRTARRHSRVSFHATNTRRSSGGRAESGISRMCRARPQQNHGGVMVVGAPPADDEQIKPLLLPAIAALREIPVCCAIRPV
jgi:hypothetical protein